MVIIKSKMVRIKSIRVGNRFRLLRSKLTKRGLPAEGGRERSGPGRASAGEGGSGVQLARACCPKIYVRAWQLVRACRASSYVCALKKVLVCGNLFACGVRSGLYV